MTLFYWPKKNGQIDAFRHMHTLVGDKAKYIGFFDVDEFLFVKNSVRLIDYLNEMNADQVLIPWRNVGYCGHKIKPNGLVIENYSYASVQESVQVKHFFKPNSISAAGVHCSRPKLNSILKLECGQVTSQTHVVHNPIYEKACVYHYQTKSLEEFTKRVEKGEAAAFIKKKIPVFNEISPELNPNLKLFKDILIHLDNLKCLMNFMEGKVGEPHRYGLLQQNRFLPSQNYILHSLLSALGNFISGAESPSNATNYKFKFFSQGAYIDYPLHYAIDTASVELYALENFEIKEFYESIHYESWSSFYPNFLKGCVKDLNSSNVSAFININFEFIKINSEKDSFIKLNLDYVERGAFWDKDFLSESDIYMV